MKQQLFSILLSICIVLGAQAQDNAKYIKAMQANLAKMATAKTNDDFQNIYNTFERIAANEKEAWAPTYYMAFVKTIQAFSTQDKVAAGQELEELTSTLEKSLELSSVKGNVGIESEIHALIAMMYSARISANPMELAQKLTPLWSKHLGMAERLNSDNPRVYLLYAQNLFYTPEAFGGNKRKAKDLALKAQKLFTRDEREKENSLLPSWGGEQAAGLLKQIDAKKK